MANSRAEQRKAAPSSGAGAPASFSYRFRRLTMPYRLAILSALLLTLAFPPFEFSWVAYPALVPLLLMASATRSPRAVFRAAWVGGVVFFGVNAHWLLFTGLPSGEYPDFFSWQTLLFCVLNAYLGLYWALFAWLLRRLRDLEPRVPLTIAAPVLWVGLEFLRGWGPTGLPWLFVGHTQYENLVLIQTADLVGAYGPSFLVVMTAGLLADLLTRPLMVRGLGDAAAECGVRSAECGVDGNGTLTPAPSAASGRGETRAADAAAAPVARRVNPLAWAMVGLTAAAWAATVGYGYWRLGQQTTRPGPMIAIVQTCVPQATKQEARHGDEDIGKEMLEAQVRLTRRALADLKTAGERADLVVWPETMVPGIMNRGFLEDDLATKIENARLLEVFRFFQEESRNYWLQVRLLAAEAEAPILFGASAAEIESVVRLPGGRFMTAGPRWNTAFLMTPDSKPYAVAHEYSKVHLVPFGETVPFKDSWPWLREQLMALSPYDFDYTVEPGERGQTPFEIAYRAPSSAAASREPASPARAAGGLRRPGPRATSQGNGDALTPAPSPASGEGSNG